MKGLSSVHRAGKARHTVHAAVLISQSYLPIGLCFKPLEAHELHIVISTLKDESVVANIYYLHVDTARYGSKALFNAISRIPSPDRTTAMPKHA